MSLDERLQSGNEFYLNEKYLSKFKDESWFEYSRPRIWEELTSLPKGSKIYLVPPENNDLKQLYKDAFNVVIQVCSSFPDRKYRIMPGKPSEKRKIQRSHPHFLKEDQQGGYVCSNVPQY